MVFITTWLVATYDFNLFFNQAHHVDRIALLLLGSLILWRPVFVFPFLLTLLAIFSQFSYPFERNPAWTEFNLFARALTLFGSALILQAVTRREQAHNFVVIFCCLIASSYWGSGIGKFRLNWIAHPLRLPAAIWLLRQWVARIPRTINHCPVHQNTLLRHRTHDAVHTGHRVGLRCHLLQALLDACVPCRIHYLPLRHLSAFRYVPLEMDPA